MVESVDPIVLDAKIVDCCEKRYCDCDICEIPNCVCQCFPGELTMGDNCCRRVLVTLGQFSIIRLERDSQLLMPVFDYCMPEKDCSAGCGCTREDPCELFQSICFPVDQFFPPNIGGDAGSCPGGCQSNNCQSNNCQNNNCQNGGCQSGNPCLCK